MNLATSTSLSEFSAAMRRLVNVPVGKSVRLGLAKRKKNLWRVSVWVVGFSVWGVGGRNGLDQWPPECVATRLRPTHVTTRFQSQQPIRAPHFHLQPAKRPTLDAPTNIFTFSPISTQISTQPWLNQPQQTVGNRWEKFTHQIHAFF